MADMYYEFREHGREEFDVNVTGRPVKEENLLSGLDTIASVSSILSAQVSSASSFASEEVTIAGASLHSSGESQELQGEASSRSDGPSLAAEDIHSLQQDDRNKVADSVSEKASFQQNQESQDEKEKRESIQWLQDNPLVCLPPCISSVIMHFCMAGATNDMRYVLYTCLADHCQSACVCMQGVPTEREIHTLQKRLPVFRTLLRRRGRCL